MPTLIDTPTVIAAAGNKPKRIEEFVGRVTNGTAAVSVARMTSPSGWVEPGQSPEFDEYTIVLRGTVRVESHGQTFEVHAGPGDRHAERRVDPLQHAGSGRRGVPRRLRAGLLARNCTSRSRVMCQPTARLAVTAWSFWSVHESSRRSESLSRCRQNSIDVLEQHVD